MHDEAEVYRVMIDRAPLRFGPPLQERVRRAMAKMRVRLAQRIAPGGTIAVASLSGSPPFRTRRFALDRYRAISKGRNLRSCDAFGVCRTYAWSA